MDEQITESETVLVNVLALLIASTCLAEPSRKAGFDEALNYMREIFFKEYKGRAAALLYLIQETSARFQSDDVLAKKLLQLGETSSTRN
jgi:hypothetical protein